MIDENTTVVDAIGKITVGDVGSAMETIFIVVIIIAVVMLFAIMTSRPRF